MPTAKHPGDCLPSTPWICNLLLIAHNHHLQFVGTATVPPPVTVDILSFPLLFVNLRTKKERKKYPYFIVHVWFSFDKFSFMYYCLAEVNKGHDSYLFYSRSFSILQTSWIILKPWRSFTVMKVSILVLGFTLHITTICCPPAILLFTWPFSPQRQHVEHEAWAASLREAAPWAINHPTQWKETGLRLNEGLIDNFPHVGRCS